MNYQQSEWLRKLDDELQRSDRIPTDTLTSAQLVSSFEVGHLLRVSVRTVQRWAKKGTMPSYRFGRTLRFRLSDVLNGAYVR